MISTTLPTSLAFFCVDLFPAQEITRANKGWALDRMVLCNEVTKWMKDDITQPPAEGVYVYGLYLEGAGWDRRACKLVDSKPKVLFEMMPVIRMFAENNGRFSFWTPTGHISSAGFEDVPKVQTL